jgi:hypothetical protein
MTNLVDANTLLGQTVRILPPYATKGSESTYSKLYGSLIRPPVKKMKPSPLDALLQDKRSTTVSVTNWCQQLNLGVWEYTANDKPCVGFRSANKSFCGILTDSSSAAWWLTTCNPVLTNLYDKRLLF